MGKKDLATASARRSPRASCAGEVVVCVCVCRQRKMAGGQPSAAAAVAAARLLS